MSKKWRPTPKQALFIDEYFTCGMNATQAAIRAGYSKRSAYSIGQENLKKPEIAEAIAKRQAMKAEKLQITADDIARELHKIAFSNAADFYHLSVDGDPILDLSELTRDQAAAIQEFTTEDYIEGRGPNARNVRRVKIKTECKRPALVDLAKLLGMMPDRHEITGAGGGPIITRIERVIVDPEERKES